MAPTRVFVVTRTSGRPRFFERMRRSVLAQRFAGSIVHVVSTDDDESERYARETLPTDDLRVFRLSKRPRRMIWSGDRYHAPYNLYFEDLYARILADRTLGHGWLVHVDDDDALASPDAIAQIVEATGGRQDLWVRWRHRMGSRIIPETRFLRAPPIPRQITTCAFAFHSSRLPHLRPLWDEWSRGDYRCATRLHRYFGHRVAYIDHVLTQVQRPSGAGGVGRRGDLDNETSRPATVQRASTIPRTRSGAYARTTTPSPRRSDRTGASRAYASSALLHAVATPPPSSVPSPPSTMVTAAPGSSPPAVSSFAPAPTRVIRARSAGSAGQGSKPAFKPSPFLRTLDSQRRRSRLRSALWRRRTSSPAIDAAALAR